MKKSFVFAFLLLCLTCTFSCKNGQGSSSANNDNDSDSVETMTEENILGDWTTTNPNDSAQEMGVRIENGGKASSINMASYPYDSWKKGSTPSTLILHGKSIGYGETLDVNDTADVNIEEGTMSLRGTDVVFQKKQ